MNAEKVLAFLNLNKNGNQKKSLPKIIIWLDVAFSVLVGAVLLLSTPSKIHIAITISFVVLDILFFIWLAVYKNPIQQFFLSFLVLLTTTLKLFYGYVEVSIYEYNCDGIPIFTWIHLAVLIASICLEAYILKKFHRAYYLYKTYDISYAEEKLIKENPYPKWAIILGAISISPMVLVRACKDDLYSMGLKGGFAFWTLGCCWLVLMISILPKCIVAVRFHAYEFFSKTL